MKLKGIEKIYKIDKNNRDVTLEYFSSFWRSDVMITRGRIHHINELDGFFVRIDSEIKGLIKYNIENNECEIVSVHTTNRNTGIGTKLLEKVVEEALLKNCKRIWLITTNDNTPAIRFFQKRGFTMKALYINSIDEARKLKPEIPLTGKDNIPILHEIEFESIIND